ncbi:MAG: hypothetical protein QOF44_5789 [Streptomyces sp.]|nr:hypothetical protein [Streptomyces sp.]
MQDRTQPQSHDVVVRRDLRVFETRRVTDPQELVAEDVLIHGAGQNVTGRHQPLGRPAFSSATTGGVRTKRLR